jgi:hypothetical protein
MFTLLMSLRDCFRMRAVLQAEIIALRHQLLVLHRSNRDRRPHLKLFDRLLWVWLSQMWTGWRSALLKNHMKDLVSADFFVVPTISFRILFVFGRVVDWFLGNVTK